MIKKSPIKARVRVVAASNPAVINDELKLVCKTLKPEITVNKPTTTGKDWSEYPSLRNPKPIRINDPQPIDRLSDGKIAVSAGNIVRVTIPPKSAVSRKKIILNECRQAPWRTNRLNVVAPLSNRCWSTERLRMPIARTIVETQPENKTVKDKKIGQWLMRRRKTPRY